MNNNEENLRTQLFFKSDMSYIINYIMKHKHELIDDRKYLTKDQNPDPQYVSEPNGLYRIILTTENDIESILKGLLNQIEDDSFRRFSITVRDIIFHLIEKMRSEKYDGEEKISNDAWYFIDSDYMCGRDLLHCLHEIDDSSYFKPNTVCARMVIKWITLYMIVRKTNLISSMEDIDEFVFSYDEINKTIRLFVWTKDRRQPLQFIYIEPYDNNVLDVRNWEAVDNEGPAVKEKDEDVLETFGLPLSTIVSEIKSLYVNYQSIIIKDADPNEFADTINEIFKIQIRDSVDIKDNLEYLVDPNLNTSNTNNNLLFKTFANDLKQIIPEIDPSGDRHSTEWFFETNNGRVGDDVSFKIHDPEYKYYKPKIEVSRIAVTWIVVYKLCKLHKLDRTKIDHLVIYYYPKKDYLRIVITIDGKKHKFGLLYAKDRNSLDMFWWHDCTTCDKCITTGEDAKAEKKKGDTKHEELKEHVDHEDKVTSSKDKRKKLLKLMILSQMMNNNN